MAPNFKMIDIPEISYTKKDYDKSKNEIVINLNNHLWLNELIEDFMQSHRRWYPQINVVSPSGTVATFAYPISEGADLLYKGKSCKLRLTFR